MDILDASNYDYLNESNRSDYLTERNNTISNCIYSHYPSSQLPWNI